MLGKVGFLNGVKLARIQRFAFTRLVDLMMLKKPVNFTIYPFSRNKMDSCLFQGY